MKSNPLFLLINYVLLFLFCTIGFARSHITTITQFTLTNIKNGIALRLTANGPLSYHTFDLQTPPRLVLDIQHAKWTASVPTQKFLNTHIKNIRVGYRQQHKTLRLVIDLGELNHETVRAIVKQSYTKRNQILIELSSHSHRRKPKKNQTSQTHSSWIDRAAEPIRLTPLHHVHHKKTLNKTIKRHKPFVLIIDPGHGGKDPGAVGYRHTKEKNITLAISKKIAQFLRHQSNFTVLLTRQSNRYVTLRQRLRFAQDHAADLFISIHADAFRRKTANGASIYALSERGATSEAARWLARHENHASIFTQDHKTTKLIQYVLIDLSQAKSIQHSIKAGGNIIQSLKRMTTLHKNKIEQAAFVVLKSPNIPSLLIETGFLSNRLEEKRLRNQSYQLKIAKAIARGIIRYKQQSYHWQPKLIHQKIKKNQSNHSYSKKKNQFHTVLRGESWWSIANKNHISIKELRSKNPTIKHDLRRGTRLRLP